MTFSGTYCFSQEGERWHVAVWVYNDMLPCNGALSSRLLTFFFWNTLYFNLGGGIINFSSPMELTNTFLLIAFFDIWLLTPSSCLSVPPPRHVLMHELPNLVSVSLFHLLDNTFSSLTTAHTCAWLWSHPWNMNSGHTPEKNDSFPPSCYQLPIAPRLGTRAHKLLACPYWNFGWEDFG